MRVGTRPKIAVSRFSLEARFDPRLMNGSVRKHREAAIRFRGMQSSASAMRVGTRPKIADTMTRYRRATRASTFFFTVVSYRRRPILCDDDIRGALRLAVRNVRNIRPFSIDGWVLLPDHLHCIWTLPEGDSDYSTRWLQIKRSVSLFSPQARLDARLMNGSVRKHREAAIWQRRFWEHQIRDEIDFERHLDYIHFNPVKHGYANSVLDWPYSTFHRYLREGVYLADWGGGVNLEGMDLE
jgi:putative transposase